MVVPSVFGVYCYRQYVVECLVFDIREGLWYHIGIGNGSSHFHFIIGLVFDAKVYALVCREEK